MWVRLKSIQYIEKAGKQVAHHPGDWIEVSTAHGRLLLANGDADVPGLKNGLVLVEGECGVLLPGEYGDQVPSMLTKHAPSLEVQTSDELSLPWERTLIWNPDLALRLELVSAGYGFLEKFDVAVPMADYAELASGIGNKRDREKTEKLIGDLRVPVYDTRLMFIRQGEAGEELLKVWEKEQTAKNSNPSLAFLRALHKVQPYILALPTTWVGKG